MRLSAPLTASLLVFVLCASGASAGSYDDAQAALGRGDYAGALRLFRDAADRGDAAAQFNLGRLYSAGAVTAQDFPAAMIWFGKAAAQGNPGAQFNLGLMYQNGQGVRPDPAAAARSYLKAADQGYAAAQVRLAAMYAAGEGVPEDQSQALKWYRQAADQGDAAGAFGMSLMYALAAQPPPPSARVTSQSGFRDIMNRVFGVGKWRETGGYRTQATENKLRAEGALTVPVGEVSRHSMGTPDAPDAYDIVVAGLSPEQTADRLRHSGVPFRRLFPEGVHGTQGAHLHVEPALGELHTVSWQPIADAVNDIRDGGAKTRATGARSAADVAQAMMWLRRAAARGNACAKLAVGGDTDAKSLTAALFLGRRGPGACT